MIEVKKRNYVKIRIKNDISQDKNALINSGMLGYITNLKPV